MTLQEKIKRAIQLKQDGLLFKQLYLKNGSEEVKQAIVDTYNMLRELELYPGKPTEEEYTFEEIQAELFPVPKKIDK